MSRQERFLVYVNCDKGVLSTFSKDFVEIVSIFTLLALRTYRNPETRPLKFIKAIGKSSTSLRCKCNTARSGAPLLALKRPQREKRPQCEIPRQFHPIANQASLIL
jgi:hypothetical protein